MQEDRTEETAPCVIAEWLETEIEGLYEEALALADQYWVEKGRRPKNEQGYLGVRVRRRETGVEIAWFRARYKQGKEKPYLENLPRGRDRAEYSEGTFRRARAKEWAIAEALRLEAEFGRIRRQLAHLTRLRRAYQDYMPLALRPRGRGPARP